MPRDLLASDFVTHCEIVSKRKTTKSKVYKRNRMHAIELVDSTLGDVVIVEELHTMKRLEKSTMMPSFSAEGDT